MSVVAFIPARGGSKGIAGKNLVDVGGKPLLAWTIEAAQASRHVDRIVVCTDDPKIRACAQRYGAETPWTRDARLATDETPTMDVVFSALKELEDVDVLALLQPTSPLRDGGDIDGCVEAWWAQRRAEVSVVSADPPPAHMFVECEDGIRPVDPDAARRARRQDHPAVWALNGAVYVASPAWLWGNGTFVTRETVLYPMPKSRSVDIDDDADIVVAEALMRDARLAAAAA